MAKLCDVMAVVVVVVLVTGTEEIYVNYDRRNACIPKISGPLQIQLEVLMVVAMKINILCDITSLRLVDKFQRFGGLLCLDFQDI
jgi:hypothetical protein